MTSDIPILLYHSVIEDASSRYAPYATTPDRFRAHMDHLCADAWTALTMGELAERLAGDAPLPDRTVAITFDDGLADMVEFAWPILHERQLAATLYVATGYVGDQARWLAPLGEGRRPMLDWDQLRSLHSAGLELGTHSHTHPHLDLLSEPTLWWELTHSKAVLEDELGADVSSLAYPHGSHDDRVRQAAIDAGYRSAVAVKHAMSSTADDRYALSRIVVPGDADRDALARLLRSDGVGHPPDHERTRTRLYRRVRRVRHGRGRSLGVTTPAPRSTWLEVAADDPDALVTQTPEWLDAVTGTGDYEDASRLYELADGRRFVLPLVRRTGWPASVTPEWGYPAGWGIGGLVGPGLDAEAVRVTVTDLRTGPPIRTVVRPNPLAAAAWHDGAAADTVVVPRRAHLLDLRPGVDEIWSQFPQGTRRSVRKAEKAGVEIECDTTGRLIPEFYELLEQSFLRWAGQQHEPQRLARWRYNRQDPIEKFEVIARELGDRFRIWMARKDGQPVATVLVLHGPNAHYTRGAMDKDLAGPTRANYALHWEAVRAAAASGCRWYQMGETGTSDSLAHFKERFGAVAVDYADYRIEQLPITRAEDRLKGAVKRIVGFRDP